MSRICEVDVEYQVDPEDLDDLLAAYWRARRRGHDEDIGLFLMNRCEFASEIVTVDGEPVDLDAEVEAWLDQEESEDHASRGHREIDCPGPGVE